jgi:predicted RNase H-like HicB family nuclease
MDGVMQGFLVVVRWVGENFAAFLPDIPGCVATGDTPEQAIENAKLSFEGFMEALTPAQRSLIQPQSVAAYISSTSLGY